MRTAARWLVGAAALAFAAGAGAAEPRASRVAGLQVGGFAGWEGADVTGLSLRADAELPLGELGALGEATPVKLSLLGSLGYSRLTEGVLFGDFTSNVLKLVPAARFTVPLRRLELFGDAGLGLAWVAARIEKDEPFFGRSSTSRSTVNLMMRLGAGAFYVAREGLRFGAMLELDPILGDYGFKGARSQTTFLVLAGAMYRL